MLEMTLKTAFNTSSRACGSRFALLAISAPCFKHQNWLNLNFGERYKLHFL
jgi:hypothetical protein